MTKKQIVILGGGTGTMTANRLRRFKADEAEIHVVDRNDRHVYQPGLRFVPFGLAQVEEIVRPRRGQLRNGVVFHENEVDRLRVLPRDVSRRSAAGAASRCRSSTRTGSSKLDATADRTKSVFQVEAIHEDVHFTRKIAKSVDAEIQALASWLGMDAIDFE